ncbi:BTAD domain-containing putative transcriptional regulator [Streptomyces acidiscabies]|uniref:BTAD domain-containing putative transcriptional regulator n=1 Tax=Streptomyces acidiscabies TaxID=42234 RepID=UPI00076E8548|nr:BTAD domain-containing putative transcriptional regulator [Streptomyces acidiscabies]GAQ57559.1 regulatory protein AfsR [Streptomyces acidiscabies]
MLNSAGVLTFRLLGPVSVTREGSDVPLSGAKIHTVLAVLLMARGTLVADSRLSAALWGDTPPPTSNSQIYTYVSRLRKTLGNCARIFRKGPGYVLEVREADVDLFSFERLDQLGREALEQNRPEEAGRLLGGALDCWSGQALENVTEHLLRYERPRLEFRRTQALERRIEADLSLGRHRALVPELLSLVARFPLDETLRAHLITALHRSDRQAEAVQVYDEGRRALAGQLGVVPGRRLADAYLKMLRGDSTEPPPVLLPPRCATFTGRTAEADRLRSLLLGARLRSALITGAPGTGKTALAIEVAHGCAETFPDGVLHASLRHQDGTARTLREVLTELLGVLGESGKGDVGRAGAAGAGWPGLGEAAGIGGPGPTGPGGIGGSGAADIGGLGLAGAAGTSGPGLGERAGTGGPKSGEVAGIGGPRPVGPGGIGGPGRAGAADVGGLGLAGPRDTGWPELGEAAGIGGSGSDGIGWPERAGAADPGRPGSEEAAGTGWSRLEEPADIGGPRLKEPAGTSGPGPGEPVHVGRPELDDLVRRYRARLARAHLLLVLDDAASDAQLTPLLPPDPDSALLVTSRAPLAAVPAAHTLTLGPLDEEDAVRLLAETAGADRIRAEPDAVRDLVRHCAGLPSALSSAGARLARRPRLTVARLLIRLTEPCTREPSPRQASPQQASDRQASTRETRPQQPSPRQTTDRQTSTRQTRQGR